MAEPQDQSLSNLAKPVEEKKVRARVWRACEVCRKRKIKCDGQEPCMYCLSSGKQCSFKEINDNGGVARQYPVNTEGRLVKLEETVQRLLPMAQAFETWLRSTGNKPDLPFLLAPTDVPSPPSTSTKPPINPPTPQMRGPYQPSQQILRLARYPTTGTQTPGVDTTEDDIPDGNEKWSDKLSHLTRDSYGNLRFIGGPSSLMLYEALHTLQDSAQADGSPQSSSTSGTRAAVVDMELPFFTRNKHFRKQELLPRVEDIIYPSAELADELVATYFARIHTTFPVLHQQTFLKGYQSAMTSFHEGKPSSNAPFLACMFAVFACASGLVKREELESTSDAKYFSGIEYYERAQMLCWISTGLSQIEQVQCLALLAICNASWNTLAQSWLNAGQALRRAQDIGLHRSPRRQPLTMVAKEIRRRVWWCVYGLDRVLSIALGRPSGAYDDDCNVEMPMEVDDIHLLSLRDGDAPPPTGVSYMTGFVALLGIYIIAGKVMRFTTSNRHDNRDMRSDPELRANMQALDSELTSWLNNLPPSVRSSANDRSKPEMLALCLIAFFMYYSAIINLHRPFIPDRLTRSEEMSSLGQCLSAARSCIRIGEMTKEMLPTSHHLAFAVQYITLSGVLLLRCVTYVNEPSLVAAIFADAEKAISILDALEDKWPASKRCCQIVKDLLTVVRTKLQGANSPIAFEHSQRQRDQSNVKRKRMEEAEPLEHGHKLKRSDSSPLGWHPQQQSPSTSPNVPRPEHPKNVQQQQHPTQMYGHSSYESQSPPLQHQRMSNLRTSVEMPQHPMHAPPHGHGMPPQHHPGYSSTPEGVPIPQQITLDLNALSAGQEVAGLPYSGYDFLRDDVFALIRGVEQQRQMPNEQMLEQNAQLLWQAYGDGGVPFDQRG